MTTVLSDDERRSLKVKMFLPQGRKTVGIISGFNADVNSLILIAKDVKIGGRSIRFKEVSICGINSMRTYKRTYVVEY
jgi:hypothetical protein